MNEKTANQSGIYGIFHTESKRVYVGSAISIGARWRGHFYLLSHSIHHCKRLQMAWLEYGGAAFEFRILEMVSDASLLLIREQMWIDTFRATNPERGIIYLTPHAPKCSEASANGPNPEPEAGAPEITDEMIAAGISAIEPFDLLDGWEGYLDKADFVRRIFTQMAKAQPS